jgi:predicted short-subunit dehydrogenase-like oxidoreductase (DUF2520 family)
MRRIGFIGAGTVGTALAVSLARQGYSVVAAASRSRSSAQRLAARVEGCRALAQPQEVVEATELVFVTTPDDAIGPVVAGLRWRPGVAVVHSSGATSLDVLEPARRAGAQVGGFHPLQTFASVEEALENLPGSAFGLEAEGELLDGLKEVAERLGGGWVELGPGDKVLYHAAAVIACNYLVTLMGMATGLWQRFGVEAAQATQALLPLLQGTLNNMERVGLPHCLTGPIARGDIGTIQKHLAALEERAPELLGAYRQLGLETVPISLAKGGIGEARAEELRQILADHGGREECG